MNVARVSGGTKLAAEEMTMRKSSVMRLFVMASAALVIPMIASTSEAQKGKGKKPPPTNTAPANTGGAVELDAPTAKPTGTGAAATQPKDLGPPPQAGQMT